MPGPDVVKGHDGVLRITALAIEVPLSEIYEGIQSN
jgi:hypothetical protein